MRLKDKAAIVTGAGAGIGRATAIRFAEEGARVMVAELDEAAGAETAEAIRRAGGEASFHRTDVADAAAVERMVEAAVTELGFVNILVNNAAAFVFGRVEEASAEDWAKVLGVNVLGYTHTVRAVLPHLRAAGGGAIVNVASMSGSSPSRDSSLQHVERRRHAAHPLPRPGPRGGPHPGQRGLPGAHIHPGERTAHGLHRDRPGGGSTALRAGHPHEAHGRAVEIANGILFLASDEASFITGAHLVIDGAPPSTDEGRRGSFLACHARIEGLAFASPNQG